MQFDFTRQIKQKTNEELTEIFINASNYNPDFVALAEQELTARNINLDLPKQQRQEFKQTLNKQFEKEKSGSPLYIFLCFVLALFGGFIAIYAGYIYSRSKQKDETGKEFYVYNAQTRQLGSIMMWLGIAVLLFVLLKFSFGL
ncbi:hypothetical protein [Parafilimonas sp.]|uniref:hypothetical protein n=1 Tax=Parafilimonas sp. TaxID=1969739 RepID=UPI003F81FBA9